MAPQTDVAVLVIDDDFMIGRIHQDFVNSISGFKVVNVARTASETLGLVEQYSPDLLLLDVYLPDKSGIELINELRLRHYSCDIILITAAKELDIVEAGLRLGVFDYLVKPFKLDLLGVSLNKYAQYKSRLKVTTQVDQGVVDNLKRLRATDLTTQRQNESGIDARTLEKIRVTLDALNHACSSEDIAKQVGVSRSTARTYLAYMVEKGLAEERLSYGTVGRPRRLFRRPTS